MYIYLPAELSTSNTLLYWVSTITLALTSAASGSVPATGSLMLSRADSDAEAAFNPGNPGATMTAPMVSQQKSIVLALMVKLYMGIW